MDILSPLEDWVHEDRTWSDPAELARDMVRTIAERVGKDPEYASDWDWYVALAHVLRRRLARQMVLSDRRVIGRGAKRVYYLSLEYLTGRNLQKVLLDLGVEGLVQRALALVNRRLDKLADCEPEPALGNGGLGRLAACLLDSLATHDFAGFGYGIRYDFGMFHQDIHDGRQVERPENWLRNGTPWEIQRPNVRYPVHFGGRIKRSRRADGEERCEWVGTQDVLARAFDVPVSGYRSGTVLTLRLWSAGPSREFDLSTFNEGDYIDAVRSKTTSETLSRVLYPSDSHYQGQELRLRQEYFFVSASLQDILARHVRTHRDLSGLADRVAIQLNDTHPALAIPELLHLLVDKNGMPWKQAWDITRQVFSYTNHTLLPEALETWPIEMMSQLLPRHLDIIYKINHRFLIEVRTAFPQNREAVRKLSLVEDTGRRIRMANLCIVGSHKVNGVAALHTQLLRRDVFPEFDKMYPDKFVNQTNGVTPRRWILQANPGFADLITEAIGDGWCKDLARLRELEPFAEDAGFLKSFNDIKSANRKRLGTHLADISGRPPKGGRMIDSQVKRIHEYKRQLLNILGVIHRYNRIKDGEDLPPRTVVFAGKAAPSYHLAKTVIKLINDVARTIAKDRKARDRLSVVFVPNYNVSLAELIIPGSDLSEQISTAGTEASGTGNMKFALNGALTIGTLDGANIEIRDNVGDDNIFIFGLDADGAEAARSGGHDPREVYESNPALQQVLDQISEGAFSPDDPERYQDLVSGLVDFGDNYLVLADFQSYVECQDRVDAAFSDANSWARKAVLNVARMGHFSSDRTVLGYARDIWDAQKVLDD